jgi:hypothetical protein
MRHYLGIAGRFGLLAVVLLAVVLLALVVGAAAWAWQGEAEDRSLLPAAPALESPRALLVPEGARGAPDRATRPSTTASALSLTVAGAGEDHPVPPVL